MMITNFAEKYGEKLEGIALYGHLFSHGKKTGDDWESNFVSPIDFDYFTN